MWKLPVLIFVTALSGCAHNPAAVSGGAALSLLTGSELSAPDLAERGSWSDVLTGPRIQIDTPQSVSSIGNPFSLKVRFLDSPAGRPPDMSTLRVSLVKMVDFDITGRLAPYVHGSTIVVPAVEIPPATFTLAVVISDDAGNETRQRITMSVAK